MTLAKQEGWQGWAFDGRKNIYTAKPFMDINQEHNFTVSRVHAQVVCDCASICAALALARSCPHGVHVMLKAGTWLAYRRDATS